MANDYTKYFSVYNFAKTMFGDAFVIPCCACRAIATSKEEIDKMDAGLFYLLLKQHNLIKEEK